MDTGWNIGQLSVNITPLNFFFLDHLLFLLIQLVFLFPVDILESKEEPRAEPKEHLERVLVTCWPLLVFLPLQMGPPFLLCLHLFVGSIMIVLCHLPDCI